MTIKFAWNGNDLKQAERRLFISDTPQTLGLFQAQREKGVAAIERGSPLLRQALPESGIQRWDRRTDRTSSPALETTDFLLRTSEKTMSLIEKIGWLLPQLGCCLLQLLV